MNNELTLIIPAKNEAESLPKVLDELKDYEFNIKVVLHKTDIKTIQAINDMNVEIIYQTNFGYGDALITGINNCTTNYFCIFNADGSFNPSELKHMLSFIIDGNYDFVFGSRYQKNSGSEDDTVVTLVGNYIFTAIGNIFFNLNITDILYTYVIGKTSDARSLNLSKKDFSFCVELPIKAKRNNKKIVSFSCYERKRIAGIKKVNAFKDGLLILFSMIKFFLKK